MISRSFQTYVNANNALLEILRSDVLKEDRKAKPRRLLSQRLNFLQVQGRKLKDHPWRERFCRVFQGSL